MYLHYQFVKVEKDPWNKDITQHTMLTFPRIIDLYYPVTNIELNIVAEAFIENKENYRPEFIEAKFDFFKKHPSQFQV